MSKLPDGFSSWVEVVDYLNSKDVKYRTVRIQRMTEAGVTTRKITLRTAERNAWREIQKLRPEKNDVYNLLNPFDENIGALSTILWGICKKNDN